MSATSENTKSIHQQLITAVRLDSQREEIKESKESKENKEISEEKKEIEKMALAFYGQKMSFKQTETLKKLLDEAQNTGQFCCSGKSGLNEACLPFIIDGINKNPKINLIALTSMKLTDKGACYLAIHLSDKVKTVRLADNKIKDLGCKALFLKRSINELSVRVNDITDTSIQLLSKDTDSTIQSLDITCCELLTPRCGQYLADCQNLKTLTRRYGFGINVAHENHAFMLNLSSSRSLTKLEFQGATINGKTLDILCEMHNLSSLDITQYLDHPVWSPEAAERLSGVTERRKLEHKKRLLPAQQGNMQMLLATHPRVGQNSPILHAFAKSVIYDKNLWCNVFEFIDTGPKPLQFTHKDTVERLPPCTIS